MYMQYKAANIIFRLLTQMMWRSVLSAEGQKKGFEWRVICTIVTQDSEIASSVTISSCFLRIYR